MRLLRQARGWDSQQGKGSFPQGVEMQHRAPQRYYKEEYLRREKGRSAARAELGTNMGEPEMEVSSEDENAPRSSGGLVDPSGSAVGLRQTNPQTSAAAVADPSGPGRAIEEIGAEAVVGVIMDNAAVCAAAGRMIEADYPHIFSVPCTAHSLDLMFESFAKIGWVGASMKRASELAKFFTNHSRVRDLLTHYSGGGVVAKPGATRFATNFIMLSSLQQLYLPLHVEKVMQSSKELLKLLKKVDGMGPTISKVYARIDSAVEKLRESNHFAETEKEEMEEIIMRRWSAMTSPLHCAALFLDPEYRVSRPETDAEVADGFWTWLYSWCKESSFVEVDAKVCSWIEGTGRHNCEDARTQARLLQPARWWRKWCSDMPILQKQAVRLLGQAPSSSCCERNWSLLERIHSCLRNNLGAIKLSTLVFNRWNQLLLDALIKKPKAVKDSPQWEEDEPVEDLTRAEMAADARMRLAEWRARLHRTEPVSDAGENDDSGSDDDDNPVEVTQTPVPEEITVQRHRLRSNLLELERQLNELWRKATKASKFLARQHLHELDQATRTMTVEHANKYKAARAIACAPPSIPAKRGRGRPRKDAATQGGTGDEEEAQDEEGDNLAGGPAPATVSRKRGRPRKEPVQEEEEAAPERTSSDESGGGGDKNDGSSDGHDGSGGCDGTDGSGEKDEGEGDKKGGCSSEEEGDSESEPLAKLRKTSH
ncbi:hypothetical protein CBR_g30294 [Chara braunii]|uniref:DUF659 domain-containing protein n=1 Tax=Chara braunii TaxID=69332 RepID=A0A388JX16_CHABU|nr:hypothetical protein CBR_g30294 [Chara braunii]|eukprot:GBG62340.1 hypothetical protein CBR_g30294 [Chara braunii]